MGATFYEFMDLERVRETGDRAKELHHAAQRGDMERTQAANTYARAPAAATRVESTEVTFDNAMHQLERMGQDKEAKKTYIQNLPDTLKNQVMQALKVKKEQAAQNAQKQDAELENLLG